MKRLKKRADFLKLARGPAVRMPGFVLQYLKGQTLSEAYVGFTVTKRQGSATMRNRIKRRLREAVRLSHADCPVAPGEYVVIGRKESLALSFSALRENIAKAFAKARVAATK
jgi:ribonuclease P protein component